MNSRATLALMHEIPPNGVETPAESHRWSARSFDEGLAAKPLSTQQDAETSKDSPYFFLIAGKRGVRAKFG